MLKKWGWLLLLVILLVAIAASAPFWLKPLLKLSKVESNRIEGLTGILQIVIWIFAGIIMLVTAIRQKRRAAEANKPITNIEKKKVEKRTVRQAKQSLVVTGDRNTFVLTEQVFSKILGQTAPPENLQQATQRYLQYLTDRYCYLDFKGMGVSDRVPLRLRLQDLYVPLKARIELPKGETWSRELKLAGREVPESEREHLGERLSEPTPLLNLLQKNDCLVILGDPGAGKTTFLKYLTLQMATGTGAETRLPVLLPLSAYANALSERDIRLDDFICDYFHDIGLDLPLKSMLKQALKKGGVVVMLDGLDEVKEMARRETVVRRVVDFYTFHKAKGNKFLLTSRIVGYRDVRPAAEGLAECTLIDFDEDEITAFVDRWTAAIEKAAHGETQFAKETAERERRELLESVQHNPGVKRLAANPLLLTILALMKRQGVRLPERRVELYQKYVETLLSSWNRARGLGRPPTLDMDVVETVRILAPLALWMHEINPGVGLVKQGDLVRQLENIYHERGEAEPEKSARLFLTDVRENTGLLLERGAGEFGFIHLTFEEYLAAVAIAQLGQQNIEPIVAKLAAYIGDDAWHEVSLLTIGYLGIVQQRDEAAGAVLQAFIRKAPGEAGQAVALAGEAVVDAWPGGVTAACKKAVVQALQQTMIDSEQVKPVLRALAGTTLAHLGDPRAEVVTINDMQFCLVSAGPFWMGSDEHDTEKPQHLNKHLDYDYWIGRYPVTVAQFKAFVEESGQKPENPNSLRDLPNQPVRYVTWYEACKFCDWLAQRWQGLLPEGWRVDLPSEAEWEKAARGCVQIPTQPVIKAIGQVHKKIDPSLQDNPQPKRRFPWGNDPDPNLANYDETGIDDPSTLGCFPTGASPYGCQEMSGNVWERTRSLWGKEWDKPDFSYPYDPDDGRENSKASREIPRVVRGGTFLNHHRSVRCAVRLRHDPDSWRWDIGFRVALSPYR